jgi:hypothetical protein
MADASSLGAFLDAIRNALLDRPGLADVNIYTGPVGPTEVGEENIVFAVDPTSVNQDYPTIPQREAFESYDVEGRIWTVKPGSGEPVIKEARDRALAILNQVQSEVIGNKTMNGSARDLLLTGYELEQFVLDGARDCRISFTLNVQAEYTAP